MIESSTDRTNYPMRVADRFVFALLASLVSLGAYAAQERNFGDYTVHYNAISTNQLVESMARQYHIERSAQRGLLNVAVELKKDDGAQTVKAQINAEVSDLTGHHAPVQMRETSENGDIDYLGEFPLSGSGAYVFTVKITPPGQTHPFVVRFNQDYVVD
jgi:Domain of unknown function (DUF4426)